MDPTGARLYKGPGRITRVSSHSRPFPSPAATTFLSSSYSAATTFLSSSYSEATPTGSSARTEVSGSRLSGSLSAGTGSATLGYKPKPLTVIVLLYVVVVVAVVMIGMFSYAINISSTYEAVACIILVLVFCLSYLRINAWCKMTKYPTIQKLDRSFPSGSFAASIRPPPLKDGGSNYKIWRSRCMLWLTAMRCEHAIQGKRTEPPLSPEEESKFSEADNLLKLSLISVIEEGMVPLYRDLPTGKDMWDALQAKFGVPYAGSELYIMEQFYDYKMVDDRSVVEQAHEIQMLAKELENNKCVLPDKFVASGIIAKLPPAWRDFATSLKHRRQEFSVTDLVASLSVEENARAKDTCGKKVQVEGGSSANLVQKREPQAFRKRKQKKNKNPNVRPQPQAFKKEANKEKSNGCCYVCGGSDH